MDVIQLIQNLGFPICCVLGMGWYVKHQTDCYRDDVKEMQRQHREEMNTVTDALNNNTSALNNNNIFMQQVLMKLDSMEERSKE